MKDKALKLALAALEKYQTKRQDFDRFADEIAAIKEALAQPSDSVEQEPYGYLGWNYGKTHKTLFLGAAPNGETELYTTPPKRQPLTLKQQQEIEIDMTINQGFAGMNIGYLIGLVIKATEAAHDIKETT